MNKLRNLLRLRPKIVLSGLVIAATLALGYGVLTQQRATAACDPNDIVPCGYSGLGDLTNKYNQNPKGDFKTILKKWGITSSSHLQGAERVTVHKNGQVIRDKDGVLVGTDANSMGRTKFNGNRKDMEIGGKTYYYGSTRDNFASNSLSGYAVFNKDDNSMTVALLEACGNPVWAVSPAYKCKELMQEQVKGTTDTYTYVASYLAKDGATISKIVYECGDGQTKTVTSNFGQKVTCKYAPGNYTARATTYFKVGNKEVKDTRTSCTKPVKVAPPKPTFKCTDLVAKQDKHNRKKFTFTASSSVSNGAVLQSGIFHFGDNTSSQPIQASGSTVTTSHEYKEAGEYVATVDLTFNEGKDINNPKCKVPVKIAPKPCEEKPEQPECKPPKEEEKNCETHPEMEECKPEAIPETGAAQIVGTMLGLGTVTGAGMYYRNSRRNLIDSIFNKN